MKLDIISEKNEKKGSIEMPAQFSEDIRQDIIQRAIEGEQSIARQHYGAKPTAGKRHSAFVSKRRRDFKATYGIGQSRTPRKVISRNGARMNWVGAFVPQTVGGRRAHPPKASKIWVIKVNNKERNFALRSAISATISKSAVEKRGHIAPENYPFIIDSSAEKLGKTKEVLSLLNSLGLEKELERAAIKNVRNGKGKSRGRKYKKKKGPLIVTAESCGLIKSARNIPGVDAVAVSELNVSKLAPGAMPGRITLWTNSAIEKISKEKLFL
jgi:large subunit ribosomal protein L4e